MNTIPKQTKQFRADVFDQDNQDRPLIVVATVRHDDECGNGHNTFSITGEIYDEQGSFRDGVLTHAKTNRRLGMSSCGCVHDDIAKHIPELAPFIKWHLTSTDGPMHYIANTIYHAGERDSGGLLKGEFKQHTSRKQQASGVSGVPNWVLELPEGVSLDVYSHTKPEPVVLEWKAYGRTGEGKKRELDAARSSAVWPEATDEELCSPDLEAKLRARLPALMEQFKAAVEFFGFTY